ncbi:MAG: IS701 family transposase [Caldilineaceae bacterium]|nr:IS701 family transposase [Caldilineaceae bacterium]
MAGPGLPGRPAGGAERKNGWQLAEANGDADPYGIQYLLNRARWSVAAARTALCGSVQEHLGDAQAVGIIDETAFLKKGIHSAGVARQYSGTAGQGGTCQVGVFLAYAGARGTLLDAELYLPKGRLQGVGLAPDTPFRTKPQLAQRLLARAQAAGVSLAWVVGDTVHGHSGQLRSWLEEQDQAYLLAVPAHETFLVGRYEYVVGEVFAALAEGDWQRLRAGPGSKGERWCDWQCLVLAEGADADKGYHLLFRRACAQPEKWQAHLVWGPPACDLPTLVRVAGSRWRIESAFELAKQEVGLDEYEVRNARGWDRHMILALFSVVRAASVPPPDPPKSAWDRTA